MTTHQIPQEASKTIEHISLRWAKPNKYILTHVFPLLARGKSVSPAEIVEVSEYSAEEVEEALRLGRADRDSQGNVTELFGFMFHATPHRIEIDGTILFSCCPLIALTVPALTQKKIVLETVDPIIRRLVKMTATQNGLLSFEPKGVVASMVRTELDGILNNVYENFCRQIHLFVSKESSDAYIRGNVKRYMVDLDSFYEIAQKLRQSIWDS